MNKTCPISSWISFLPSPDISTLASGAHRNMISTQLPIVEQSRNAQSGCSARKFQLDAWSPMLSEWSSRRAAALRAGGLNGRRLHSKYHPARARLHEYQGKAILAANGFKIPRGCPARTAEETVAAAAKLGGGVVIKLQAWTTGRAGIGGVAFTKKPDEVRAHAGRMLSMKVGQF